MEILAQKDAALAAQASELRLAKAKLSAAQADLTRKEDATLAETQRLEQRAKELATYEQRVKEEVRLN